MHEAAEREVIVNNKLKEFHDLLQAEVAKTEGVTKDLERSEWELREICKISEEQKNKINTLKEDLAVWPSRLAKAEEEKAELQREVTRPTTNNRSTDDNRFIGRISLAG